jgi:hypothetical protein
MARPREWIPSDKELNSKVKMVQVEVEGQYLAQLDERRRTSRTYKIKVLVPEGFTMAHVKHLTPLALREAKDDFMGMRTFKVLGKPAATKESIILKELYTEFQLRRFAKKRLKRAVAEKAARQRYFDANSTLEGFTYDADTDMPKFAHDPAIDGPGGGDADAGE